MNIENNRDRAGLKEQEATDRKLVDLAKYEATKGGLVTARRSEIVSIFRELKRMVMTGSEDLAELETWVMGRWGYPQAAQFDPGIRDCTPEELAGMPKSELCGDGK